MNGKTIRHVCGQKTGQPWWHMSLFPVLKSQRQALRSDFQASKGYMVRLYIYYNKNNNNKLSSFTRTKATLVR